MNEKLNSSSYLCGILLFFVIWICEVAIQRGCLWAIYEPPFPTELEDMYEK